MTYYSADGSYLRLTVERNQDWTLYYPDGSKVVNQGALQRVYDRNGSYYDIAFNTITDDAGRSVSLTYDSATGDDLITQTGVGGASLVWRIKWKTVSIVNKGYSSTAVQSGQQQGNSSIQQWTADYRVVDKIILPTQLGALSFTFNYNTSAGWAEVSSVVMPADASETPPQVTYQYTYPGGLLNGLPKCTNILSGYPSTKTLTWQAQADGATTPVTETWLYDIGATLTYITAPDGGVTTELHGDTSYPAPDGGLVKRLERPDGSKTERIWALNPQPYLGSLPPPMSERNAFIKTEFNTIKNAGGTYVKTAIKDFAYDKNGNALQVTEYDWVDYSLVPKDAGGLPTGIPGGLTPKRVTLNTYNNATPDSSTPGNHANAYWNIAPAGGYTTLALNAVASTETRATVGGAVQARTEYTYDNPATTANVTATRSWDSTKGPLKPSPPLLDGTNSIVVTNQYGTYSTGATGKLIKTIDAKSVATSYTYGDIGNGVTDLYVTKTVAAETTAVARTSENKYDFNTGAVTEAKDTDNNVITKTTLDVFGRPTLVEEADGTTKERRTATEYSDTLRRVITRSDLNATGDGKLVSIQHYDQLGRIRLSRTLEDSTTQSATNEQHGIKVQTRYAYSGSNSYEVVSAPFRAATSGGAGGEAEMAWKRTKFDNGGKVIELETFAGATLPAPWGANATSTGKVTTAYDAEFTTVSDQTNKSRRSMVDGLGRLARVDEPDKDTGSLGATSTPVQPTSYSYNALGNLTQTVQGAQTRSFSYSSLGRLTSATNPENGAISYQYDNNGNLTSKTDARGITATYTYDALNRNTSIGYSGGSTPVVERYYDGAVKGKGKLWYSLSYNLHPTSGQLAYSFTITDSYDELGRPLAGSQQLYNGSQWKAYPVSRSYDIAGNVKTQTYPSGRTVTYNYDNAGRTSSFSGYLGDGMLRIYADTFTYNAFGQIKKERFGATTPLYHNIHYNSRGQAVDIRLGTSSSDEWHWNRGALITYFSNQARSIGNPFMNAADNNGNVTMQEHYVPTDDAISSYAITLRDTYEYDYLNRIKQVTGVQRTTAGAWRTIYGQGFIYDRWGNRRIDPATGVTWGNAINNAFFTIDPANNNRLVGLGYDAAGNVTNDTITGSGARAYDAENRMTSAQGAGGTSYYVYDADGKRVRRITGGVETWHIYGFGGELIAEYPANGATGSPSKEYGYRGGQMLIVGDATNVRWTVTDALGTPRIVAGKTGLLGDVTRHDYLPFGEELYVNMGTGSIRTTGMGYGTGGTNDGIRKKFTGYERDDETGLDFAQARYYSSRQGRFTSPDEFTGGPDELFDFADVASDNPTFYADLTEPQSLNKYQYCYNDPLSTVDPDGHKGLREWARQAANVAVETANGVVSAWVEDNFGPKSSLPQNKVGRAIGHGVALAQSLGEFVVGSSIAAGGAAGTLITAPATETGVGAALPLANAAAAVGGVVVATHGIAVGINTARNISSTSATSSQQSGQSDGRFNNAKGQTSSGHPTDQYGNKLGPSGKPMIHQKNYSSKKAAKDAARNAGNGSPMHHPSPRRGEPHFHPTKNGKKVQDGTHYNYPEK